jgi:hypothetical protein
MLQPFPSFLDVSRSFARGMRDDPEVGLVQATLTSRGLSSARLSSAIWFALVIRD